jgi:hypothetical protein
VQTVLEDRPAIRNSLAGAAAFSFVFLAAMMGTAFMMTGGFGFGGEPVRSTPPETRGFVVVQQADAQEWSQHMDSEALSEQASVPENETWLSDHEFQEAAYETELAGDEAHAPQVHIIRSEADIARDISRSFAADYTAPQDEPWEERVASYDASYAHNAVSDAYPEPAKPTGLY